MSYHYAEDAPTWRQIADTKQKARKWYACEACPLSGPRGSAMIPPGQEYRKIVGLEDGELVVFRQCCGPCPNAEPCAVCNGTGDPQPPEHPSSYCTACDGTGKARRAALVAKPAHQVTKAGLQQ